ncbi:amino acid adenylation domain-containing protein [Actinomycetes bacterium KLBMP 9797]
MVETIPGAILARAQSTPAAIAVRQWSAELTYRELVSRATALATELRGRGAGPGTLVGLCARREPATVAALLGIWFAGAAYVPVDLGNPRSRARRILDDAGAGLVVADAAGRALFGDDGDLRYVAPPGPGTGAGPVPPRLPDPDDLAYVMYTSGSTGRPKGVLTTHRNIAAWVAGCPGWLPGIGPEMRALAMHSLAFDASCYDLFVPLTAGGAVQLAGEEDRADPARLQRFLAAHRVTWAASPPAVATLLEPAALPHLEVLIVGGEVVPPELVGQWTARGRCRFFHAYGPTEATVVQVATELRGHWTGPLPLGAALPGHRLYIVDEQDGEGELGIAGPGVALGYLNRPELTAERFVPEPDPAHPDGRMYRTGDLVRRLPDGGLVFVGRRDGQVQVRGQRVELGEVEAALRAHPRVRQAAVVATAPQPATELIGYLVPAGGDTELPEPADLRAFLATRLPAAMIPRTLEWRTTLPLTTSGKVDHTALMQGRAPSHRFTHRKGPFPTTDVAALWERVLGVAAAPDADFFAAGGHSLDAMRLIAAIRAELGRDVGVADLFAARTLAALAERVAAAPALAAPTATGVAAPALSPAQRRMWFLDKLAPGFTAYNLVFAERLRGPLDPAALRAALTAVATRHAVLRWRITDASGLPVVVCDPAGPVPLPVVDLAEAELPAALTATAARVFDLAHGPLWSATLYRLTGSPDHVLALAFHHAIMDGWSQSILYADLADAYRRAVAGEPARLPALPFGYADYVAWRARRDAADGAADLRWWNGHLRGAPTTVELPADRLGGPVRRHRGATHPVPLGEALDRAVRRLATTVGATPATVVLAALGEALHRLTGRSDVLVGAVVADRGLAATHDAVGFFVDVLPVRLRAHPERFADAVKRAAAELLAATAHPAATLEQLVAALRVPREPGQHPLVQVIFNAYTFPKPHLDLPGTTAEPVPLAVPGAPVDLTVYLVERGGALAIDLRYDADRYDPDRIARLGTDLVDLLGHLVAHPDRPAAAAPTRFRTDGAARPRAAHHHTPSGPRTDTERAVAAVWCEVLGVPAVRATDNFFDAGGTSFGLVRIQARLNETASRAVTLVDLFRFPTVRALAAHLDAGPDSADGGHGQAGVAFDESARLVSARRARNRNRRNRA